MEGGTPGLKEFDCKNKHHVLWLQKFTKNLNDLSGDDGVAAGRRIGTILSNNPCGVTMPPAAFIDIHAGISIKYATAVLEKNAWLPRD